jgi:endonuclease YncB( thermonuclease family)
MILHRSSRGLVYVAIAFTGVAFAGGVLVGAGITAGVASHAPPKPKPVADVATAPPVAAPRQAYPERAHTAQTYPAEVVRVIDGDTFEARVRIWPGMEATTKVRLRGIDAPEMSARCADEQAKAKAARTALADLLAQGDVWIAAVSFDKYGGRVLATASTRATADVSRALLAAGVARPYGGGRRESWCGYSASARR